MKGRGKFAAVVAAAGAMSATLVITAPEASAATTSTVVGSSGCNVGSTEFAIVKGDLDNSHPPAQRFNPSWWNGNIDYKITFSGITNSGLAYVWVNCNIAPDHGGWVRTNPGRTSTLNF
jgi:hypothetical protein